VHFGPKNFLHRASKTRIIQTVASAICCKLRSLLFFIVKPQTKGRHKMSDNPQTVSETETELDETETETEENASAIKTLDDVKKRYFAPDEVFEKGGEYFAAVSAVAGENGLISNFDLAKNPDDGGFPENYGLAIIPISQRTNEGKNETVAVVAAAIPTLSQILSAENGQNFVAELVSAMLTTRVANAARPRDGQTGVPILPRSLADFMEGGRRESTKGFMDVAPAFVKELKRKGMKQLTVAMLRECLQSTATARQYFPKISQEAWVKLGNIIIAMGEKQGHDMSVPRHWVETRDEASARVVDDSVLEGLFGE